MKINEVFKNLIPALTPEEYAGLEESIVKEGCRDNLLVWNDTLIDGHNRYEICSKHGIPFKTTEKHFNNESEVKEWIILNQFGRRNLSAYDRSILALRLKNFYTEKAKEQQISNLKQNIVNKKPGERKDTVPQTFGERETKKDNETNNKIAKIAGVSHETIRKVETIEQKAPEEVKQKIKEGELSINKAYTYIKRQEVKENIATVEPPKGKYRIVYADPPWCYGDKRDGLTTGAEDHYPSMTIQELCELPINELSEDNAVLFMWVTSPLLEECFAVIKAWGFKYKTSFVWDKVKHNMGHYNSVRHELLLICTKGSCLPDNKTLYDSVVSVERSEKHSEKPEEFRNIIDSLYNYGNKIELFSRKQVDGWAVWGNQA